jgi:hypothetical protein
LPAFYNLLKKINLKNLKNQINLNLIRNNF